MMRVNLLPPEILQRRQAEKRIGWVAVGAIVVVLILAVVWGIAQFQLQSREDDLAVVQQQVQAVQAQADQLAIFEVRAEELEARRATADQALAGRREWSRLFNELSLILPADMWADTITASEDAGLSVTGYAVDTPTDVPDQGHRVIAKSLVRLADLEQLSNVWLTSSMKSDFNEQSVLEFMLTADVAAPEAEGGAQ
ncbi:MAG: hypothetical protein RBS17_09535 [Coriobacteriia bacterium]|nr:hypothetical protein [Coriobacteriia bacterium]